MKRSEINEYMRDALDFFSRNHFYLPPFAYWTPEDWATKGPEVENIVRNGLGWDITDYGMADFHRYGLLLFTLRNGNMEDFSSGIGVPYAEKIMIAEEGQEHQMHFHNHKQEDIINRAGGDLVIELYNAAGQELSAQGDIELLLNGQAACVPAGTRVVLRPGESITLPTRTYHKFWAEGARVMIGEVSMVNDDRADNVFHQPFGSGRFSEVVEDEPPLYLLFTDYARFWGNEKVLTER